MSSIIVFHLSKLRKATFYMPCYVTFVIRLPGKLEIVRSWEWKAQGKESYRTFSPYSILHAQVLSRRETQAQPLLLRAVRGGAQALRRHEIRAAGSQDGAGSHPDRVQVRTRCRHPGELFCSQSGFPLNVENQPRMWLSATDLNTDLHWMKKSQSVYCLFLGDCCALQEHCFWSLENLISCPVQKNLRAWQSGHNVFYWPFLLALID